MLYPKNASPFDPTLFKSPTAEYRGTPFWAWNCKLESAELTRQIDIMQEMGLGGFHMHVRTGLAIPYLGDEYMSLVRDCVEKARTNKMLAWLYDEDRWPSGAAGGIITKNKEFRLHHLLLTRKPYGLPPEVGADYTAPTRNENGSLLACFDVCLDTEGRLSCYTQIGEHDNALGFKLYAYVETAAPGPWFNNQTYVDTLNPAAIEEFIRITHERYKEYFADDFGGVIPAIFTDEPQFSRKTTLRYAHDEKDVTLPWTPTLPTTFAAAYPGESLVPHIPELLWELPTGVSRTRYLYHDHVAERFAAAFADICGAWCSKNGLMLTGHMMEEPTLKSQTHALGDAMRSYRSFGLPGIDMLCDRYEYTTAKQAQSACHQYGNPGVLSELYGVTNWDYDFRGHKTQGDWQAALGVTVRVPHLSWVSMNGEAKRDYPGTFNYQAPWYKEYALIEDHFARVNVAMTRGRPVVRVGVIHPIESYWLYWGAAESTKAVREQKDEQFLSLTRWLLLAQMDFDFIAESLLPDQCDVTKIADQRFPVGQMAYDVVVVPNCETLRTSTLERLERFRDVGGNVVFMGEAPKYLDARPSDRGQNLYKRSTCVGFERTPLLNVLSEYRAVEIFDSTGGQSEDFIYQLREDGDCRWLFVSHAKPPINNDIAGGDAIKIRLLGSWRCTLYDTITGQTSPLACDVQHGYTTVSHTVYAHDSLLLRLDAAEGESTAAPASANEQAVTALTTPPCWTRPVPVTLEESNVLLLDIAEYSLNGEAYRPAEEILRLDNILRGELGWPVRKKEVAQPWVENDETTPHKVALRYTFDSEVAISGAKLALERPDIAAVKLNGADVPVNVNGWYVDKSIKTINLPEITAGPQVLEVTYQYGRKVDLESLYLLGDFGVLVAGSAATLTTPVKKLAFGDITRQGLPFYGGNIVYHLETEIQADNLTIEVSNYRGHLLGVSVNGKDAGRIVFAPYRLTVDGLTPGTQKIDLRFFGNRINTFGQLHCVVRDKGFWWGGDSWRTKGAAWSYEYKFWEQGIMKGPAGGWKQ